MKNIIVILFITLFLSNSYGQDNSYFGSSLIPRNEYLVRLAGSSSYWTVNIKGNEIRVSETGDHTNLKFMFIPAGEGFYFIKFQANGNYLSLAQSPGKSTYLQIGEPVRNNSQKFKVISIGNNHFKFISFDKLAIEYDVTESKLRTGPDKGGKYQTFEIVEESSMKKL